MQTISATLKSNYFSFTAGFTLLILLALLNFSSTGVVQGGDDDGSGIGGTGRMATPGSESGFGGTGTLRDRRKRPTDLRSISGTGMVKP